MQKSPITRSSPRGLVAWFEQLEREAAFMWEIAREYRVESARRPALAGAYPGRDSMASAWL